MNAIVGLGNVGDKYKHTRHNVGFMFVDKFPKSSKVVLLMPDTMMNSSGVAVLKLIKNYKFKTENLFVVHDDLDIKLGEYKIQRGRGPKVHNGINSIEEMLGTSDFWRVRIGVDNRDPDKKTPGEAYVLQNFSDDEMKVLENVIKRSSEELLKKING